MNQVVAAPVRRRKDFESDQDVRWCPGCGDYMVLAQVQQLLANLGLPREQFAFVSGIGCSSRFPYYLNTYGLHGIHGRAPAIASGLKLARPDLAVWVVTGDGDALAIGGNHLIHALRRNIDLKILLLNNRIYGLTKGQVSPTSELGKKTKSTPAGSIDRPFNPVALALGAGAGFVARTVDTDLKHLGMVLARAAAHKGAALVEVLQNCMVFNDGAYANLGDKELRDEHRLLLAHGEPLRFGRDGGQGVRLRGLTPERVDLAATGTAPGSLLCHDERDPHGGLAALLAGLEPPHFPLPLGVFRAMESPTYEDRNALLLEQAAAARGTGQLQALLAGGETWTIEARPARSAPCP